MLESQISGDNDSWAIRWYASAFLADKLTLYPGLSLIQNIGNDDTGTHSGLTETHNVSLSNSKINIQKIDVVQSDVARKAFKEFFMSLNSNMHYRIWRKISKLLSKFIK
jgi:hypothetical protein